MSRPKNTLTHLLIVLPLLVAVLLYGYAVRLPFFLDDGPNFWLVQDIHHGDHWDGSKAFPFYRPLPFSLWKFTVTLLGSHEPSILHLLNVLFFGAAGVMLGRITQRAVAGHYGLAAGIAAGIGFVLFPFSYQAVTWISSLFHLMSALGLTLSLWCALVWLDRGNRISLVLCWLSAFFGVFSHENGPLIVPLLVGLILVTYRDAWPSRRRIAWLIGPLLLIAGIYTALWFSVHRTHAQEDLLITNQFDRALAYLLQGLAYPSVALVRLLIGPRDVAPGVVALVVLLTVIPAWIWAWRQSRRMAWIAAFGAAWYVISLLASAALLAPDYVLGSPRLMLFASMGGSLFWGVVFALAATQVSVQVAALVAAQAAARAQTLDRRARVWGWRIIVAALVIVPLLISLRFLWLERADFIQLGDYTDRLGAQLKAFDHEQTGDILIVNAPNYVAPGKPTFLLGAEGAAYMLNTLDYVQQIWVNTGLDQRRLNEQIRIVAYNQTLQYESGSFNPHGTFVSGADLIQQVRKASAIYVTYFDGDTFWPVYVGGAKLAGPDEALASDPETGVDLTLADGTYSPERHTLTVRTRWRMTDPLPVKLFVHVFCDGAFIAQSDGYMWGDLYPFSQWTPVEIETDRREIRLENTVDPGCLRITTGVYWESDPSSRLPLADPASGEPYPDGSVPVPLVK